MALLADTASINTILGEGSSFSDGVRISGNVRVEGDIDGSVDATGCVFVGERARIRGDVSAELSSATCTRPNPCGSAPRRPSSATCTRAA